MTLTATRPSELSPTTKARLAGALYLATILMGVFTQQYIAHLISPADAATTAANIAAHQSIFRLGFAVYLVELACQIAMTLLFYDLLKPVSRTGSLLAATFSLVGCTIKIFSRLFFFAPLVILGGAHYLSVFPADQLHALALLSFKFQYYAECIAMIFFGFSAIQRGYLVFRSTFLPRALGILSAIGGLGWLTYLYEPLAVRLSPIIVSFAVVAGISTTLWLLFRGVDQQHWSQQAAASNQRALAYDQ